MKNIKGFTLIELMIVMTVIAILASMVLFGLNAAQKSARDVQRESIVKAVQTAIQAYEGDLGAVPTSATWGGMTYVGPNDDATALPARLGIPYLPKPLIDPGCGSASGGDVRGGHVYTNGAGSGVPNGCSSVTYTYKTSGFSAKCVNSEYEIDLTKESGGTLYFCGPQ